MSMITGMFRPTKGTVSVNGFSVMTDTIKARRNMSLCPQHNILYDELTVYEHLKLYAAIKGLEFSQIEIEIKIILEKLQLLAFSNKKSEYLSGGMKRKLCLAIALIGGSKILILDEPTSGMDASGKLTFNLTSFKFIVIFSTKKCLGCSSLHQKKTNYSIDYSLFGRS